MHIFKNTNFNFLQWRWQAIALSWAIIIAGAVTYSVNAKRLGSGIPLGIEFAGGTEVVEQFDQPVTVDQVRSALDKGFPGGGQNAIVSTFGEAARHEVL